MTHVRFTTQLGTFDVQLEGERAPLTVRNFVRYVEDGAYDGAAFSRVVSPKTSGNGLLPGLEELDSAILPNGDVPISVVQGDARTGARIGAPIALETTAETGLSHLDGTLSMGRLEPDSATTEFFLCLGDQPALDFGGQRNPDGQGFAAFGRVSAGMDVVRAIHASPAAGQSLDPVIGILSVRVLAA